MAFWPDRNWTVAGTVATVGSLLVNATVTGTLGAADNESEAATLLPAGAAAGVSEKF